MNNSKILSEMFARIASYLQENNNKSKPVIDFKSPKELKGIIDFPVNQAGTSEQGFLKLLDQYLEYSVKTGNKQFLNQLYAGFNFPAFIGEICTTLTNTSQYTYEVAPVATLVEMEMIKLMNRYTGYTNGDGIFVSGGSNANMVAMFSARNRIQPESRFEGYDRQLKLTAFINEQAHYSFETAANLLGIGANNVIKVKTDNNGMLIPAELEKEIKKSFSRGEKPFFVAATCGTTLAGAYDPLGEMSDICKQHEIWLHADGSFGGSVILSDEHRHLLSGIEKTDSFAWNPHKLMNIPLICSALLVKSRGVLEHNLTDINTDYIYHGSDINEDTDVIEDVDVIEDLGKKSIQCGRRIDAVKLWFAWKYYGLDGYQKRVDNLVAMAEYVENKIKANANLELMIPRQSFTVCFRFRPNRDVDLNEFNLGLREALRKKGKTIVNYGYLGEELAIRLVTANGELEKSDIDLFFEYLIDEALQLEGSTD